MMMVVGVVGWWCYWGSAGDMLMVVADPQKLLPLFYRSLLDGRAVNYYNLPVSS